MNTFFRFLSLDAFSASIAFKLKIILKADLGREWICVTILKIQRLSNSFYFFNCVYFTYVKTGFFPFCFVWVTKQRKRYLSTHAYTQTCTYTQRMNMCTHVHTHTYKHTHTHTHTNQTQASQADVTVVNRFFWEHPHPWTNPWTGCRGELHQCTCHQQHHHGCRHRGRGWDQHR